MPTIRRTPFTQHSEFTRKLIPEDRSPSGFDVGLEITTRQHRFGVTHLSVSHITRSCLAFPQRSLPWLLTTAAWGCLRPASDSRSRWAHHHLFISLCLLHAQHSSLGMFCAYGTPSISSQPSAPPITATMARNKISESLYSTFHCCRG